MFTGKISFSKGYSGLYVAPNVLEHYTGLYTLEGKYWNSDTMRHEKILRYADSVYVALNGDIWYYAAQNNHCVAVVRIEDRQRVYTALDSIGITVEHTDQNTR